MLRITQKYFFAVLWKILGHFWDSEKYAPTCKIPKFSKIIQGDLVTKSCQMLIFGSPFQGEKMNKPKI